MTSKQVTLRLHTPEQAKPDRQSLFVSSKRFVEWLESLPLGNMTAAGNELLTTIQEFNQTRVPPKQRAEMLDRVIEPVLTVVGVLDRHSRDTAFPLSEKSDRIGRVAISFFREIALGYRIAAHELVGDGATVSFLHKKQIARWLHCSMSSTEQMFLRLASLYQQISQGAWQELNRLYLFAARNDLQNRSFEFLMVRSGSCTIEDIYRRTALFGISDPQRLGQRAIRALFQACPTWSERCHVRHDVMVQKHEPGLFEIDASADEPPLLITDAQLPERFEHIFDLRELRVWLSKQQQVGDDELRELTFRDSDGKALVIDRELIAQLLSTWGVRRRRSFQRLTASHELKMIVGLAAVHFTIAGDTTFPRFLREFGDPRFAESAARDRARFGESDGAGGRPTHYTTEVLNQSLGGYRLRLNDLADLQIRVGEVVAVCPASLAATEPLWMVGMVRWINAIDVRELEVGISLLGRNALPAALLVREDAKMPPHRALAMEPFEREPAGSQPFLITSSLVTGDQEMDLCIGDTHNGYCGPVDFGDRLERTSEVTRIRYETEAAMTSA